MSRYAGTKVRKTKIDKSNNDVQRFETTIYEQIPSSNDDIFVLTQEGDRLDNLAFQFYGNQHLWWYIAHANNLNNMNVEVGTQLRIPVSTHHTNTV